MLKLSVTKNDTLLNYLLAADTPYSKSKLKSLLKHECIAINQEITTQFDDPVVVGDTITIITHNNRRDTPLDILYEDDKILVINKPSKLLTIATKKQETATAYHLASDYVKKHDPKQHIFVIHRLDQDTSGVLMFAKSQAVQKRYQDKWNERVKERLYLGIVEGVVEKESDTIESFLRENKTTHMYSTTSGQKAITHYELVKHTQDFSLLKITITTGRKNQIRVHMHDIKHPIIGDKKYNSSQNPLKRLGLHAYRLRIINPDTHKEMVFTAPIPPKFKKLVKLTPTQEKAI